jgi:hypothetical protein
LDGQEYGFCKLHDPVAIEAKSKARLSAWQAELAEGYRQEERRKATIAALDACKAAIEQIAAGHNDPMALAIETLSTFPPPKTTEPGVG